MQTFTLILYLHLKKNSITQTTYFKLLTNKNISVGIRTLDRIDGGVLIMENNRLKIIKLLGICKIWYDSLHSKQDIKT